MMNIIGLIRKKIVWFSLIYISYVVCSQPACAYDILEGHMAGILFNPIFSEILDQNLARPARKNLSQG